MWRRKKNKFLLERIKKKLMEKIELIDDLGINGDFVESQAFAYLYKIIILVFQYLFREQRG